MKRYLWIGSYMNDEVFLRFQELGYNNSSSYITQRKMIEGLEDKLNAVFDTIGCVVLPPYPECRNLQIEEVDFSHKSESRDALGAFLNIKYLNKWFSKRSLQKCAKKWIKDRYQSGDTVEVFVYELRSACLEAARIIKKNVPNARVHLIIPDLPQFMDLAMNKVKRFLKAVDWRTIKKNLTIADDYVLFSTPMAEFLGIENKKWMLMEGMINFAETDESFINDISNVRKKVVMYSGALSKGFGIDHLLEAFTLLDDGWELWITGGGAEAEKIKAAAAQNSRIVFYGFLKSRDKLLELQNSSTVLINMRDPEAAASNYCFPSKLFDYMLTGRPVLSCRLGGIPEEYFKYLLEIKSIQPKDIAEAIRGISDMPPEELEKRGANGREFLLKEKSMNSQAQRIVTFIGE